MDVFNGCSLVELNKELGLLAKECQIFTYKLLLSKSGVLKTLIFQFVGSSNSRRYHRIFKLLFAT